MGLGQGGLGKYTPNIQNDWQLRGTELSASAPSHLALCHIDSYSGYFLISLFPWIPKTGWNTDQVLGMHAMDLMIWSLKPQLHIFLIARYTSLQHPRGNTTCSSIPNPSWCPYTFSDLPSKLDPSRLRCPEPHCKPLYSNQHAELYMLTYSRWLCVS